MHHYFHELFPEMYFWPRKMQYYLKSSYFLRLYKSFWLAIFSSQLIFQSLSRWTGSDRNPKDNAGNGQQSTDRNNVVLLREQTYAEGNPGAAIPLNLKNGHWGANYPTTFNNGGNKTLMGFQYRHLQKLALVDDLRKFEYYCEECLL